VACFAPGLRAVNSGVPEATREVGDFVSGLREVNLEVTCFVSGLREVIREVTCFARTENRTNGGVAGFARWSDATNDRVTEVAACTIRGTFRRVSEVRSIMNDDKNALVVSTDPLPAVLRNESPLVDALMLVEGLRQLQQRIPDFTQLSPEEVRSLMRAAYLSAEFREKGLQTAAVWNITKNITGRSGEELRAEEEVIRHWDEVEQEWTVILKGIAAANLKRKHHLGTALLKIYRTLRVTVRGSDRLLRPYFDAMKEAYLKGRKKPAKTKAPDAEPGTPAE